MPSTKLRQFLDQNFVRYTSIPHFTTYTAQETAAAAHIRGRELAKTVMVKVDGAMAMAVLPATLKLDPERLREAAGAKAAILATEQEFKDMFPDCEVGAMPPFGNLYNLKVYADESLAADEHIAFNAGTHAEVIEVSYEDFLRLVQPSLAPIAWRAKAHA